MQDDITSLSEVETQLKNIKNIFNNNVEKRLKKIDENFKERVEEGEEHYYQESQENYEDYVKFINSKNRILIMRAIKKKNIDMLVKENVKMLKNKKNTKLNIFENKINLTEDPEIQPNFGFKNNSIYNKKNVFSSPKNNKIIRRIPNEVSEKSKLEKKPFNDNFDIPCKFPNTTKNIDLKILKYDENYLKSTKFNDYIIPIRNVVNFDLDNKNINNKQTRKNTENKIVNYNPNNSNYSKFNVNSGIKETYFEPTLNTKLHQLFNLNSIKIKQNTEENIEFSYKFLGNRKIYSSQLRNKILLKNETINNNFIKGDKNIYTKEYAFKIKSKTYHNILNPENSNVITKYATKFCLNDNLHMNKSNAFIYLLNSFPMKKAVKKINENFGIEKDKSKKLEYLKKLAFIDENEKNSYRVLKKNSRDFMEGDLEISCSDNIIYPINDNNKFKLRIQKNKKEEFKKKEN